MVLIISLMYLGMQIENDERNVNVNQEFQSTKIAWCLADGFGDVLLCIILLFWVHRALYYCLNYYIIIYCKIQ